MSTDKAPTPTTTEPAPKPPRKLIRFDFAPGTTPEQMHAVIEAMRREHGHGASPDVTNRDAPAPAQDSPVPPVPTEED